MFNLHHGGAFDELIRQMVVECCASLRHDRERSSELAWPVAWENHEEVQRQLYHLITYPATRSWNDANHRKKEKENGAFSFDSGAHERVSKIKRSFIVWISLVSPIAQLQGRCFTEGGHRRGWQRLKAPMSASAASIPMSSTLKGIPGLTSSQPRSPLMKAESFWSAKPAFVFKSFNSNLDQIITY